MRRHLRRPLSAGLALAVAAPLLTGCFAEPSPHNAVKEFLVGWQSGDFTAAARRTDGDPAAVSKILENVGLQLDSASFDFALLGLTRDGDRAEARYRAEVDLGENNPRWRYDGTLPLRLVDGRWKVRWSASVIHPKLGEGQRLAVVTDPQGRQPVLDRNGDPLQAQATLYVAGVFPASIKDPAEVAERLSRVTGFPQDRLLSKILSAPPKEFVQLATFGRAKYTQLRAELEKIPGVQVQSQPEMLAPAAPQHIIGQVNAVTAETQQALGGPQRAGDTIGRSGLQKAYQDQLTGSTETRIITLDTRTSEKVAELAFWPGRANAPVRTTLDRRIQDAAQTAVAGGAPVALVAVQASTGEILAVGTKDFHQERDALAGRYPAGTVFSMIAMDGLLRSGADPGQKVPCAADRTVGGARFQHRAVSADMTLTLKESLAQGCATALAALARRVDASVLADAAERFGIGASWWLPLESFSGAIPEMDGDAAKARVIAGTSVQVSPLAMALAAGAVASGTWRPPALVSSPATTDANAETPPPPQPNPITLDEETLKRLRPMLRAGVTSGVAKAAAAPGDPVYGIASTVAYIDKKQRENLAWFVGWQGDIAVAVMIRSGDPAAAAAVAGIFFRAVGERT